ncbi:MAG TPA: hypothetical protein H9909_07250 [Candidatus Mediterraneibacter norfolkensis]|nr:hypothetical protein [Candidatus Mediterraneibacter norfolkensis]
MEIKQIKILDQNYLLAGISQEEEIQTAQNNLERSGGLSDWKMWRDKLLKDRSALFLICDPCIIKEECSETEKENYICREIISSLKVQNGVPDRTEKSIKCAIKDMLEKDFPQTRVYGSQCSIYPFSVNACIDGEQINGKIETVLLLNSEAIVKEKGRECLLPVILHETTHYLEELCSNLELPVNYELLSPDSEAWNMPAVNELENINKILEEEVEYQKKWNHERLTTLVERMTILSLFDSDEVKRQVSIMRELFRKVVNLC